MDLGSQHMRKSSRPLSSNSGWLRDDPKGDPILLDMRITVSTMSQCQRVRHEGVKCKQGLGHRCEFFRRKPCRKERQPPTSGGGSWFSDLLSGSWPTISCSRSTTSGSCRIASQIVSESNECSSL